jgi:vacuolar-type H+-ATPase catalytic subunit A/Vma1
VNKAIETGIMASRIASVKVKDEIARMKYTPNQDFPKRYEELITTIETEFESLRNQ